MPNLPDKADELPDKPTPQDIAAAPEILNNPSESIETKTLFERINEAGNENLENREELERSQAHIKKLETATEILDKLIEPFAHKTFNFMIGYCVSVLFIVMMVMFGLAKLESSILQVLVGSTAVTVIGLTGMVLTGIFVGARRKL